MPFKSLYFLKIVIISVCFALKNLLCDLDVKFKKKVPGDWAIVSRKIMLDKAFNWIYTFSSNILYLNLSSI